MLSTTTPKVFSIAYSLHRIRLQDTVVYFVYITTLESELDGGLHLVRPVAEFALIEQGFHQVVDEGIDECAAS